MIELEIDGKKVEAAEGSMIIQAAFAAGLYIPHFCYHKKLSIAANCRMCLVDVEKMPKPMPACALPVAQGMVVRTHSEKAIRAQQAVMEFLLINHPLDCPICDQGGECQLQDLAVGYGESASRFQEPKRVVFRKEVGPLISMEEMTRCIHCTRCIRFGIEIGGVMELGMVNRGEHAEITTVVGDTIDSELSGNMIDICPVGAITSKPFRFSARTWELLRRKSVSPHDSTGANLVVQVKNNRVLRVVPLENEDVNECWIADRDRFSYEALDCEDRLTQPMLKQDGQWVAVDWQTALEYVANGLKNIKAEHGAAAIGLLASPHSTLEELVLAKALMNGLGSGNIDTRLRHAEFTRPDGVRWLGTSIASLSTLDRVLVVGSNLRKDHPLFAQRIRQAARAGCSVNAINSVVELGSADAWAMPVANTLLASPGAWAQALADVAAAVAAKNPAPLRGCRAFFFTGLHLFARTMPLRAAYLVLEGEFLSRDKVRPQTEVAMNKLKFVMAAGLLAATAACTQTGYDNSYAYNNGYNTRPVYNNGYYAAQPAYSGNYYAYNNNSGYYRNGYNTNSRYSYQGRRGPNGDYDRDGVPNRRDIDANGDQIPDVFQR